MRYKYVWLLAAMLATLGGCGDADKAGPASTQGKADGPPAAPASAASGTGFAVSARSHSPELGPQGLFSGTKPGWHSVQPPKFPEMISVDFGSPREVRYLGLLAQEGQAKRGPKALRVETSNDGNSWTPAAGADDACTPNTKDGWFNIDFVKPANGRYLRLAIFSNCGDAQLLTLRGLRVN